MKLLALSLLLVCSSCVHYKIYRTGRHERVIEVSDSYNKDPHRLAIIAVRKAKLLGCSDIKQLERTATRATYLCIEKP